MDLVVPLQDASPRLRFHVGGVGADGQPKLLAELPEIPGPASSWYLAQWQQRSFLVPDDLKPLPGTDRKEWRALTPDGHSSVTLVRSPGGWTYTLAEMDGMLTEGGGANLFLSTKVGVSPADFGAPVELRLRARLSRASVAYATATAERSGAVQAMAFVGLGLMFHPVEAGRPGRFVFMQVPITVSRPVPPGPGIMCSLTGSAPALLYSPDAEADPFRVQERPEERRYDLTGFVRAMLSRPYPCGGRMMDWPQEQKDPARWQLAGLYVGLEVQNRDERPGSTGGGEPQGHAAAALELSGLSVRRGG